MLWPLLKRFSGAKRFQGKPTQGSLCLSPDAKRYSQQVIVGHSFIERRPEVFELLSAEIEVLKLEAGPTMKSLSLLLILNEE